MFRWYELVGTLALGLSLSAQADFPGIGQPATESEIRVWDTDIGPDLSRLPNARGSVREGREIYRVHCAGCHGVDGRSADVFYPLVGGTTDDDVAAGRVAGLRDAGVASSSTMMLLPTLTTLLDYTARAMPFGEAGSLSHDEVFAVSAFVLHLAGVVDEAFVLDLTTAPLAQERLPNRDGFTTAHGLWPGGSAHSGGMGNGGMPDVASKRCMNDCAP
jgi:mono/diheme cytochrome c family protein